MKHKIDVLLINIANLLVGVECTEIKKVIMDLSVEKGRQCLEEYKAQQKFCSLYEIFKCAAKPDFSAFIIIGRSEGADYMVEVPAISTIINIDLSRIMVIPGYLRKKQEPFFAWGAVNSAEGMILLVTFSFFNAKKDNNG